MARTFDRTPFKPQQFIVRLNEGALTIATVRNVAITAIFAKAFSILSLWACFKL
jgi:hypothetical protein